MGENARILLVDDDPVMRELASAKLTDACYGVVSCDNGRTALDLLKSENFDLVVADLDMPVMTGYELTAEMRKDERLSLTPVIVITGSDHAEAVDRAFAVGATSFIAKPVNWALLGHSVKFVLKAAQDHLALREARDQAEAGARFKDSLLSMMSHELRTPLNAIIGFGQIISDLFERNDDKLHREYAEYIVEGGKRLLNSVSDMLLASDTRSGPITINDVDYRIDDLVQSALSSCDRALTAADAEVSIALKNPETEIRCDHQMLSSALVKLIDNAVKFGGKGVRIVIGATQIDNGELALVVTDNGPGISDDKLALCHQPFAQSDMSLRRSKEGLGLGLPLVLAITNAHGASFKIKTKIGKGTTVAIILPADRVNAAGTPLQKGYKDPGATTAA